MLSNGYVIWLLHPRVQKIHHPYVYVCVKQWLCMSVWACLCANEERVCACAFQLYHSCLGFFCLFIFSLLSTHKFSFRVESFRLFFSFISLSHLGALNFSRNIMVKWAFSMLLLLCVSFCLCVVSFFLHRRRRRQAFASFPLSRRLLTHPLSIIWKMSSFSQDFSSRQKCNFILSLLLAFLFIFSHLYLFVPTLSMSTPKLKNTHSSSLPFSSVQVYVFVFPLLLFCFRLDSTPFDSVFKRRNISTGANESRIYSKRRRSWKSCACFPASKSFSSSSMFYYFAVHDTRDSNALEIESNVMLSLMTVVMKNKIDKKGKIQRPKR